MKFLPWKDYKQVAADLKLIYKSITEKEGKLVLERFSESEMRNTLKSVNHGIEIGVT